MAAAVTGAVALCAGPVSAGDPMADTYDNTVITKNDATGAIAKLLFNKDMTYTGQTADKDGKPVSYSGSWVLKDDGKTICLTPNAPPDAKETLTASCSPLEEHKVGDSWKVTNDQKQIFDVSLVGGR